MWVKISTKILIGLFQRRRWKILFIFLSLLLSPKWDINLFPPDILCLFVCLFIYWILYFHHCAISFCFVLNSKYLMAIKITPKEGWRWKKRDILGTSYVYRYYFIFLECPFHCLPLSFFALHTPPKYICFSFIQIITLPAYFEIHLIWIAKYMWYNK